MYVRRAGLGASPVRVLDPVPASLRVRIVQHAGEREGPVPDGDTGTFFTLALMRDLVRADVPLLAPHLPRIVGPGNLLVAVRRFLAEHVVFRHDPTGVELLKAPAYQLAAIRARGTVTGDCDDIATLGAALGLAAGFPARFVVLRFDPGGPFEHVYTELRGPSGWVELDTSRELQRVPRGVEPAETATFDVGAPGHVPHQLRRRLRG